MWAEPIRQEVTVVKNLPPYERPPSKTEPGVVDKKKFTKGHEGTRVHGGKHAPDTSGDQQA
jgi:hypothetical protein